MRRARSSGGVAPGALAAVLVGGLASLFLLALLGFLSVFHAEFGDYRTCYGRAITESARAECRASFETAVRVRLGLP
jgi:hypothetical protein